MRFFREEAKDGAKSGAQDGATARFGAGGVVGGVVGEPANVAEGVEGGGPTEGGTAGGLRVGVDVASPQQAIEAVAGPASPAVSGRADLGSGQRVGETELAALAARFAEGIAERTHSMATLQVISPAAVLLH